jgi:hypothetical protein
VKRNFNELFLKPAAQARVKARSYELLKDLSLHEIEGVKTAEELLAPSADANSPAEESLPHRH